MNSELKKVLEQVKNSPGSQVKLAVADIDGILRGKYIHKDKFNSIMENGSTFCDVVWGWDCNDQCYENVDYSGLHTGFPDVGTSIDPSTLRFIPWDHQIPFFLADFCTPDGQGLEICPRNLLKKVIQKASGMGFVPFFAEEFEWYNFAETPESFQAKGYQNPTPITEGMFGYSILRISRNSDYFHSIFNDLLNFRIPIEGLHPESGPGTYEAAITVCEILEAADRAVLFKSSLKELAYQHNMVASFMAKWNQDLPGCGGHIHQSLWDPDKKENLFYDEGDSLKMSPLMKSYIAGMLHCLPEILPMYAPNINSYKRLVEGAWAPTTLTWGVDNRTASIRALPGGRKSTRIEMRVPGADVNPYLAMAACLASGLYGIKNNLKLKTQRTTGNGYLEEDKGSLSRTLEQANNKMKDSSLACELFGETFVKHFTQTRDWEWKQHLKAVTDWEFKRYFEII